MKKIEYKETIDPGAIYARYYDFSVLGELMRQNIEMAWRAGYQTKVTKKSKAKKARKHK